MEPYLSGQFGFIDEPDRQFGNGSVWTRTRTRSDGPEPLLTLTKRNRKKMMNGRYMDQRGTHSKLIHENRSRISPTMSSGIPSN